ncbi:MAG: hypothetical protein AB1918_09595 [Pseudomonadota bacterium]
MKTLRIAALAGIAAAALTAAAPAEARGWGMGGGHGPWGQGCERDTPLTTAQVKDIIEGKIAWRGEDLKVGKVEETTPGTILAEVVKPDGSVARKVQVDAKTGRFRRAD